MRARQIEAEEATLHHLKVEEAKRKKERRMFEDKILDNEEMMRVQREQKQAYEEEERARARESEQNTIKDMELKAKKAEQQKVPACTLTRLPGMARRSRPDPILRPIPNPDPDPRNATKIRYSIIKSYWRSIVL